MISAVLDSVPYCYILLPCLPYHYIPHLSFYMSSSAHLDVSHIRPRISVYCTRSTAQLGVSCIHPIILTTRYASLPTPLLLLHVSPFLSPLTPFFLKNFFQGRPKLFIFRPLAPPCLYPDTAPFVYHITCTYFKYWLQSNPLRHSFLSSPYVGYI